jgi:hypothetical protein
MRIVKTPKDTVKALDELKDAFVKARAIMDGNDMETWTVLLRYETKISQLKQKILETA